MQTGAPLYIKDKISLIAKKKFKKRKKKRPPDLEKFVWMDAKQAIFFISLKYAHNIFTSRLLTAFHDVVHQIWQILCSEETLSRSLILSRVFSGYCGSLCSILNKYERLFTKERQEPSGHADALH